MKKRERKGFINQWVKSHWSKPVRPIMMLIPTLILAMLLVVGSTLAWYISTSGVPNDFASGKYKLDIVVEDVFTPNIDPPIGSVFDKTVGAENNGDIPGFVRLLVEPIMIADDDSQATPLPAKIGTEVILVDLDTTYWKLGEDGYYYYTKVLMPGESAPPLFTKVQVSSALALQYDNATFNIEVKCEAVDYYSYDDSGTTRYHFRDAFWANPLAAPPALQPNLLAIDTIYVGLAG